MCNGVSDACSIMHFPTVLFLLILLAVPSSVKYCTKWILLVIYWNLVRKRSSLGLSCLLAKGTVSIRLQGRLPRSPNTSGVSWYLAPLWFFPELPRCTDVQPEGCAKMDPGLSRSAGPAYWKNPHLTASLWHAFPCACLLSHWHGVYVTWKVEGLGPTHKAREWTWKT